MYFFSPYLANTAILQRTWALSYEGNSPAWAFLIFLILTIATVIAYQRCASGVTPVKRIILMSLRITASALLAALLTKPILQFTEYQPVKQPLAVLIDGSLSMTLPDRRETALDLNRAAIATGLVDPARPLAPEITKQLRDLSRSDLIAQLGTNRKLDLWTRLAVQSDLVFYQFGTGAKQIGTATSGEVKDGKHGPPVVFPRVVPDQKSTAIGESLRQVLQEPRSQALGGVLLITDGGNNSGSSPIEAAQVAKEQNVPLFIYGVGVTSPPDVEVSEVSAQRLAFIGERLEVRARIASRNLVEKPTTITLKADGEEVDYVELLIGGDREQEVVLHIIPKHAGEVKLEVSIPIRPDEAGKDNNSATTNVRITDSKFHVLLIEREPRWDFRYLLDYLQRDPRLEVKCVMIHGEPGLDRLADSPFLPAIPATREELFKSQVLILGDVNPADLGVERMQMIAEWVEAGGGIIFLAGSGYNPAAYTATPLEPLLPVVAEAGSLGTAASQREPEPYPLELTTLGRRSAYLQMDADPEVNQQIWESFPGIRWAAPVARAKPGADVLLVDPRPQSAGRYGQLPVFAMQGYGSGKCVYFGTDETYRWRSKTGEKYYSILWGQIMQTLALQLLDNASPMTQLRTDRKQYSMGDRVIIAGNVYSADYAPLIVPVLEGTVTISQDGKEPITQPLNLVATDKNSFRGDFIANQPGSYTFHTARDPEGVLKFEVADNNLEKTQTALDDRLLKAMATAAGGRFIREEDLRSLPDWVSATTTRVATYRKVELYYSAWILSGLLALLFSEWLMRRLTRLK